VRRQAAPDISPAADYWVRGTGPESVFSGEPVEKSAVDEFEGALQPQYEGSESGV